MEAAPADRGYAFGLACRERVGNTVTVYRHLLADVADIGPHELAELGAQVGRLLEPQWPALVAEVEGLAAGAAVDVDELLALNARTELLAGRTGAECSVAGAVQTLPREPRCLVGENWDWHPDLADSRVTWVVSGIETGWLVSLTEAGMLAKIGMNARGLCVALNFLTASTDGGVGGVPIHVLLRLLLERCGTMTQALHLLANAKVSASACITLASVGATGAALVAVELSPGGVGLIWADERGGLGHTNHFLEQPAGAVDREWRDRPGTLVRLWTLQQALHAAPRPLDTESLAAMLRSHFGGPESVCRHPVVDGGPWHERRQTLASVIMDPANGRFLVADGPPCSRPHVEVRLPRDPASPGHDTLERHRNERCSLRST